MKVLCERKSPWGHLPDGGQRGQTEEEVWPDDGAGGLLHLVSLRHNAG